VYNSVTIVYLKLFCLYSFQPSGVFVLEHSQVQAEMTPGTSFAFSLAFQDEQSDRKHLFSARSEEQVQQWVTAIQSCRYVHKCIIYKLKFHL
jgi:hypothetical protein